MKLIINKKVYDNKAPYEGGKYIGETYKLLNKHLMKLGYGSFNCDDLYEFWNSISDKYGASWLGVPEDIEDFKRIIGYDDEEIEGDN